MEGNVENIHKFLEIPLDGEVRSALLDLGKPVPSVISNIFFGFKNIKTNFTVLDLFRIFYLLKPQVPVILPYALFPQI